MSTEGVQVDGLTTNGVEGPLRDQSLTGRLPCRIEGGILVGRG